MLIWLNGAFGAGKTQTAYALAGRLPGSYVYDPENVGFFLRDNLPPALRMDDFQDYPQWRSWNREILCQMAGQYSGDILIPMTITDSAYFHEITDDLAKQFPFRHIILTAGKETILRRLRGRGEKKNCWAAAQIDRCLTAFAREPGETGYLPGERLATDELSLDNVTEAVAGLAGIVLAPDRRGPLRRIGDRAGVWMRHIRL